MTCVVGLVHEGSVIIGADSIGYSEEDSEIRGDPKVFKKGRSFVIGFAGSFRVGQLIRHRFTPPRRKKGLSDFEYMVSFASAVKKFLWEEDEEDFDTNLMVGYKGKLYVIQSDYNVAIQQDREFDAIGSGAREAKGAMRIMTRTRMFTPEEMVKQALEAAEYYNPSVRGPFNLEVLK